MNVLDAYDPTGYMGDTGDFTLEKLGDGSTLRFTGATQGTGPHEWDLKYVGGKLNATPAQFTGVMMLDPANNYGTDPRGGWDLRGAKRLTWKACSGENDVVVKFGAGGADWHWNDATGEKVASEYPDSLPHGVVRTSALVTAKCEQSQYQSFSVPLDDVTDDQLARVVSGFSWTISWSDNGVLPNADRTGPAKPKEFVLQLRDITYEKS